LYFGNFVALLQGRQPKHAIYMSVALMGGMLVKPVLYPFAVPHIFILIAVGIHHKVLLQRTVVVAMMPLVAVLLYNYWNYTRTDKFHFTSNQAFNASYYYYPFISQREGIDSANRYLRYERAEYAVIPEYKDRYDYANDRGKELLKHNLFPYMLFHLKNSARMLVEPGKAEMDLFTGKLTYGKLYSKEQTGFYATWKSKGLTGMSEYVRSNPSLAFVVIVFLFNCVRLVGFLLFFRNVNVHWIVRIFTGVLVVYFVVAAGPIGNTRYFLPVSLIVAGCAVLGFKRQKMVL
jgi:hypothetical protein